jgi:hypothetical protein
MCAGQGVRGFFPSGSAVSSIGCKADLSRCWSVTTLYGVRCPSGHAHSFQTTIRSVLTGTLHGREKLVSALPAREAAARVARDQRWGGVLATQAGKQAAREDVLKVRAR